MKIPLHIKNIVMSGRMPFKRKMNIDELSNLIKKSDLNWQLINDEVSPIIRRFVEKETFTVHGKKGNHHISIWVSGAIIITGIVNRKQGEKLYLEIFSHLLHIKSSSEQWKKCHNLILASEIKDKENPTLTNENIGAIFKIISDPDFLINYKEHNTKRRNTCRLSEVQITLLG